MPYFAKYQIFIPLNPCYVSHVSSILHATGKTTRKELMAEEYTVKKESIEVDVQHFSDIRVLIRTFFSTTMRLGCVSYHPAIMSRKRDPTLYVWIYRLYENDRIKKVSLSGESMNYCNLFCFLNNNKQTNKQIIKPRSCGNGNLYRVSQKSGALYFR